MVFLGNEQSFVSEATLEIGDKIIKLLFREIQGTTPKTTKWEYKVDDFTFETVYGGENGDGMNNVYKKGKLFISNLQWKSLERLAKVKNWKSSVMHNEWLRGVGRMDEKTKKLAGKME